jgi:hypothetical protein
MAWLIILNVALLGSTDVAVGAMRRAGASRAARVGREFKVGAGRAVTFDAGRLRLKFLRVASDSRCPRGVDCVWAGNAEVLIEVGSKGGRGKMILRLNTNASQERAAEDKYLGYTVRLLELTPYPREGRKTKPGEYIATLLVVKD